MVSTDRRRALAVGAVAGLLVLAWQWLTVHYNFHGEWTALFRISSVFARPGAIAREHLYVFPPNIGFDGVFFHMLAHRPWINAETIAAMDAPSLRYGRILVPLLAWMLAFGRDAWIDAAYVAVIASFVALGAYWLSRLAMDAGRKPQWGLLFILMPATITSVDAMVCDVALCALVLGFAWCAQRAEYGRAAIILGLGLLVRETALPIFVGYGAFLLSRQRLRDAIVLAAAALPGICWLSYIRLSGVHDASGVAWFLGWLPLGGLARRLAHPRVFNLPPVANAVAVVLDNAALLGALAALCMAGALAWKRRWDPVAAAAYGLAIFFLFLRDEQEWLAPYGYGRVMTPLLLLVALKFMPRSPWLAFAPALAISARLGLNLAEQLVGVIRGILG